MADEPIIIEQEEWRDILGFEGSYQVSSMGRVRSLNRTVNCAYGSKRFVPGVVLKQNDLRGYKRVALCWTKTDRIYVQVHILVCSAFNGAKPSAKHQVAHRDGIRSNNFASNLRWATAKENCKDRELHGTTARGERSGATSLTNANVIEIRNRFAVGDSRKELARRFGVLPATITNITKRRTWSHI